MPKRLTKEIFIERSDIKHDHKYDYSLVVYINSKTEVKIICPKHGIFDQMPISHLQGHGCSKCGDELRGLKQTSNTEKFICDANLVHGPKYDYSLVDYINSDTEVKIICKEHGVFPQSPRCHLTGHGCPRCAGKNKTTEELVDEFNIIHDFKYDYSLVDYINSKTEVKIICPKHGLFTQIPHSHLRGHGCDECAVERRTIKQTSNTEEFANKSDKIHDNKYDYSGVYYINSKTEVEIICPKHGAFPQTPNDHLGGAGCPECAREQSALKQTSTTEEFNGKADKIHDHKYDYSLVEYVDSYTEVNIICPEHGVFSQRPNDHLQGHGCYECGREKTIKAKTSSAGEFIEKANPIHGFKYDYTNVIYKDAMETVEIICPQHGPFPQTPSSHLSGRGCPRCVHMISRPEVEWLNSLNIPDDKEHRNVYIKIKGRKYGFKVDGFDPATNTVYEFNGDFWHGNPLKFPPDKINPIKKKTYGELYQKTLAKEALLKSAGYNVISIWESEFKAGLDKIISV